VTIIEIFDVFGRKQKAESRRQNGEREVILDIANLSAGVYFVRLTDESGFSVQKFVKE